MSTTNLRDGINLSVGIPISVYPSTVTGATIDRKSQDSVAIVPLPVLMGGAAVTLRLQDSPDGVNWTNVTGAAITVGSLPNGTMSVAQLVRLNGKGRYVRLAAAAPSAGSPSWGAILIFGQSDNYIDNKTVWLDTVL